MTQLYQDDGTAVAVTVIQAGPCIVTRTRPAAENGGHAAIQMGFEPLTPKQAAKPQAGAAAKAKLPHTFRFLREMHVANLDEFTVGQALTVERFAVGQRVDVIGVSKGKGFQGVIKRHKHHGGVATHGSMFHRAPGGIGASAYPSRVLKNRAMPGHMGAERVTAQNLTVIGVRPEENLLLVRGAVPGATNGMVIVRPAIKVRHGKAAE
jgi:large subunit ribosomal protein L3